MRSSVLPLALLPIIAVLSFSANAEPVTLPLGATGIKGTVYEERASWARARVGLGIETNFIDKAELKDSDGEIEGNISAVKIVYSVANRVDLYAKFGVASGLKYKGKTQVDDFEFDFRDEFAWGAGIAAVLYEDESGLSIITDLQYQTVQGIDYNGVTVNGVFYSRDQLGGSTDAEFTQWHVALGLGYKFSRFTPYAGIKFVGSDYSAKATSGGTTYDAGSTEKDSLVGAFFGLTMVPADRLAIDIQGRVVDEEALSASLTFMF